MEKKNVYCWSVQRGKPFKFMCRESPLMVMDILIKCLIKCKFKVGILSRRVRFKDEQ